MGDATSLITSVREAVREVDNTLPLTNVTTQIEQSEASLTRERLFARLMSFFAVLVTLLSAIGLYGVMAYSVAQRTIEIGIRMALGARSTDVLRLVVWQGMRLVLVGLVIGAIAAIALRKIIESRLYGVKATDPLTFVAMSVLLIIVALAACLIPARRAARIDPMIALRNE
jgi:putative ABC transport system permease protein